ncbi:hypothetical protein M758_9G157600 [Ceratodon purpureus]|nr:hypothetical protein M758_9G157600 [Ceratodon purpureus]
MGRGQQRSVNICMEVQGNGKAHMESELMRSMARQRRVVCVALFTALITFSAYVVYINSGIPPEEDTSFFDGQPAPASLLDDPLMEDVPNFTNSTSTITNDDQTESGKNVSTSAYLEGSSEGPSPAVNSDNLLNETFQNNLIQAEVSPTPSQSLEEEETDDQVLEEATPTSTFQNTSNLQPSNGECDLKRGEWIPDSRPPMYNSSTCRYIQAFQNCAKNGRPDDGYLYWKWKPDHCEVPRVDARAFLTAMRNRLMVFAGDSIARNQIQSLLCVLAQVEDPKDMYHSEDDRNHIYLFQSYNFTLRIHWAPYLVRVEDKPYTWPDSNKTEIVTHVYLDELAEVWVKAAVGADVLQLSAGQWWYKKAIYLEKGEPIGCHTDPPCFNELGFAKPYGTGIANVLKGSLSIPGFSGTTVYRSFAPDHFEGGDWDTGGYCNRTTPGGVPLAYLTELMYSAQIKQFKSVTEELDIVARNRLKLLDITNLAQIRADGHPNSYRNQQDKIADKTPEGIRNDCLHWCLPGPIDTWNDLLVESLRDVIFR